MKQTTEIFSKTFSERELLKRGFEVISEMLEIPLEFAKDAVK